MDNNNVFLAVKAAIVAFAGAFSAAFGWLGWVICMVVDYISGSAAAMQAGKWSSAAARAGIWHKGGMLLVVVAAALTDGVLGIVADKIPSLPVEYTVLVLPVVLVWYILTELGSVAENAAAMGAPVPPFLTKLLAAAKDKVEDTADKIE